MTDQNRALDTGEPTDNTDAAAPGTANDSRAASAGDATARVTAHSSEPQAGPSPLDPDATPGEPEEEPDGGFDVDALAGGLSAALEAILMVTDEPVSLDQLAAAFEVTPERIGRALDGLRDHYQETGRGFTLRELDTGWRIYSRADLAPAVEKFMTDGARARLSKAALETLAVIAYRQPVSRARVGAVRGVNVDGVVRTLVSKGLITEVGLEPEHGAVLYGTTGYFLDRLGIGSLEELPPLAPYLPELEEVTGELDTDTLLD